MKVAVRNWYAHYQPARQLLLLGVCSFAAIVLILLLGRICLMLQANVTVALSDYWRVLGVGFFYDLRVAALALCLPLICGLLLQMCWPRGCRWSRGMLLLLTVLTLLCSSLLTLINIACMDFYGYPMRYASLSGVFDQGLIQVLSDAIGLYWHYLLLCVLLTGVYVYLLFRLWRCLAVDTYELPSVSAHGSIMWRLPDLFIVLLIGLTLFAIQAVPGRYYLWSSTLVNVSRSDVLNKTVYDPYSQLVYSSADADHTTMYRYLDDDSINDALQRLFPDQSDYSDIDALLTRQAAGRHPALKRRPEKIFIIVAESLSSWAVSERARELQVTPEWQRLAAGGHTWTWSLQNGGFTIDSLTALVMGVVNIDQELLSRLGGLQTAPAWRLNDHGYPSSFYSSSFYEWSRLDRILPINGFSIYRSYADNWQGPEQSRWGLHDQVFFEQALQDIERDDAGLHVLLTTANHPPYNVPDAQAYALPQTLRERHAVDDETASKLGHMWYSDQCLGSCVDQIMARWPESLVVITGDHYARFHPFTEADTLTHVSVPIMLYAPNLFEETGVQHETIVSSLDIMPTVCEMCLPQGTPYCSWGHSLFDEQRSRRAVAYCGDFNAYTDGSLLLVENHSSERPVPVASYTQLLNSERQHQDIDAKRIESLTRWYSDFMAVMWYRIHHGSRVQQTDSGDVR